MNDVNDSYKKIEQCNPDKKRKILIVLDDMIPDILSNKKLNSNWLNSTPYFIMKIPNRQELQQIAFNHSSDTDFKDLMNLYQKCTANPYSFLVTDSRVR